MASAGDILKGVGTFLNPIGFGIGEYFGDKLETAGEQEFAALQLEKELRESGLEKSQIERYNEGLDRAEDYTKRIEEFGQGTLDLAQKQSLQGLSDEEVRLSNEMAQSNAAQILSNASNMGFGKELLGTATGNLSNARREIAMADASNDRDWETPCLMRC